MEHIEKFIFYAQNEKYTSCEDILKNCSSVEREEITSYQDRLGNTFLLDYTYENNSIMSNMLIRHHSDVNRFNVNGKSPLIHAAINKNDEIIEMLLGYGADANAARTNTLGEKIGANALMFACEKDNLKSIDILSNVTDGSYLTDIGHNAFMFACQTNDDVTRQKLKILSKNTTLVMEKYDKLGGNYLICLAKRNDLPLLQYCVLELGIYSPGLLPSLIGRNPSITKINEETVEYIQNLYNTMAMNHKLERSLGQPKSKFKGLKI